MLKVGRKVLFASAALAISFASAVPAHAYYVIAWNNSYGGGLSYHCDNGIVFHTEGVPFEGQWAVFEWAPGAPPC